MIMPHYPRIETRQGNDEQQFYIYQRPILMRWSNFFLYLGETSVQGSGNPMEVIDIVN